MDDFIKRERYLTECRDNAARGRIRARQLTREERSYRKHRAVFWLSVAVWAVFLIGVLVFKTTDTETTQEQPVAQETASVLVVEVDDGSVDGDYIEAAPAEYDPVRDDIPMEAETQRLLYKACDETGIRYELALAVVWQETNFRNVVGDGGESAGYMQIQEKWHRGRMERLGVSDLSDPYGNFLVGCDFLAELVEKHDIVDALTKYNSGKTGDSKYAQSVLNYMNILTMEEF